MTDDAAFEVIAGNSRTQALAAFADLYQTERWKAIRFLAWLRDNRPEDIVPVLRLVATLPDQSSLAPTLFDLTRAPDAAVRATSALILARSIRNPQPIEHLFEHPDSRVRANVVEGIHEWNRDPGLLRRPLTDPHHRVLCAAIVSLYGLSAKSAVEKLRACLAHEDWHFRAAGTWALGAIGDPHLRGIAATMRCDPHPSVRWNALRALSSIHRASARR